MSELLDRYAENIAPRKKHFRNDIRHLNWWREQLGSYLLSDITPSLITQMREVLLTSHNCSESTANRYMATLSHAFTLASTEWEWVDENPCRKVRKLSEPRGRIRYLSEYEIERLLDACRESTSKDLYLAVVLSLSTGARQGEIMNLTWNQIDLDRKVITLYETKNKEIRTLPISTRIHALLTGRLTTRRIEAQLLFPSNKDPNKPAYLRDAFEVALKKAGISNFRWHDLRHTTASYLAMNGATLAEIAEVLGHKTLAMVKRYSHLSESHTAKVIESMNQKMFKDKISNPE